jgi:hypothetical protein
MEMSPKHLNVKITLRFGVLKCFESLGQKCNNKLSPQYIIVKVLKCKYQKWIRTLQYLEFQVESYGQNKGHESNSQFDS